MIRIIYYPVLYAITPVLLLFTANVSDIPISRIFPSILILPLICAGIFFILRRVIRNDHRAGFLTLLIEIWFFNYGAAHQLAVQLLSEDIKINLHLILIPIWSLLFILLGSKVIWRRIQKPELITSYLNILTLILIIFSVTRIVIDIIPRFANRALSEEIHHSLSEINIEQPAPDIYYLIVDGYSREDVLSNIIHFDNSPFIKELEKRGFEIASQSKSNYVQTALSLASSLNLEYLSDISPNITDRGQLIGRINHSQVRGLLEQLNYKIVTFSSGYLPTEISDSSYYFFPSAIGRNYNFEAFLALNTITKPIFEIGWLKLPIEKYAAQQECIEFTVDLLSSKIDIPGPKFIFAHLLIPHPPFIFNENGPITPTEFYILADGERLGIPTEAYQTGYSEQLKYTNQVLLRIIDQIQANSDQPPIIIIQADHGSGLYYDSDSVSATCPYERFSILSAVYLPDQRDFLFPDDITSVNIFRLIFNQYFGTEFKLLPDHQFYSTWNQPYDFIDVTELTDVPCNDQ